MKKCQPGYRAYRMQKMCVSSSFCPLSVSTFHLSQEAETEKASILEQYTDLAARKAVIDAQQATLLREMKGIKEQIQNFEQHRSGIMVSIRQCLPHDVVMNRPCRPKLKWPW